MEAVAFTLIPVVAVLLGSLVAVSRRPSEAIVSAMQHLAAGVVFAAAAAEILPQVMHEGSPIATFTGGALGIIVMLSLKAIEGVAARKCVSCTLGENVSATQVTRRATTAWLGAA